MPQDICAITCLWISTQVAQSRTSTEEERHRHRLANRQRSRALNPAVNYLHGLSTQKKCICVFGLSIPSNISAVVAQFALCIVLCYVLLCRYEAGSYCRGEAHLQPNAMREKLVVAVRFQHLAEIQLQLADCGWPHYSGSLHSHRILLHPSILAL